MATNAMTTTLSTEQESRILIISITPQAGPTPLDLQLHQQAQANASALQSLLRPLYSVTQKHYTDVYECLIAHDPQQLDPRDDRAQGPALQQDWYLPDALVIIDNERGDGFKRQDFARVLEQYVSAGGCLVLTLSTPHKETQCREATGLLCGRLRPLWRLRPQPYGSLVPLPVELAFGQIVTALGPLRSFYHTTFVPMTNVPAGETVYDYQDETGPRASCAIVREGEGILVVINDTTLRPDTGKLILSILALGTANGPRFPAPPSPPPPPSSRRLARPLGAKPASELSELSDSLAGLLASAPKGPQAPANPETGSRPDDGDAIDEGEAEAAEAAAEKAKKGAKEPAKGKGTKRPTRTRDDAEGEASEEPVKKAAKQTKGPAKPNPKKRETAARGDAAEGVGGEEEPEKKKAKKGDFHAMKAELDELEAADAEAKKADFSMDDVDRYWEEEKKKRGQ